MNEFLLGSLALKNRLDSICDEFESQWKSGSRPNLSDYLTEETRVPSQQLLLELIQIDMHYRRKRGETPDARDYLPEFTEHATAILNLSTVHDITAEIQRYHEQSHRGQEGGHQFGKYELREELGKGGFGVVWKAWDTELHRWVALKIARVGDSPEIRKLFRKEARVMAAMSHPQVVRVIDFGIESNLSYIVSELVDGKSLAESLKDRELTTDEALQFGIQIASGLEYVHAQGIVHRDLKPSNVLLNRDGQVVVADFGLARQGDAESTIMQPGQVIGSMPYMSPEQMQGHPVDESTDIYALGVILYRMLTGQRPFDGSNEEIRHQVLNPRPPEPRELNPEISPSLSAICLKAMAADRQHRYRSVKELRIDLEALLAGETVIVKPPPPQGGFVDQLRGDRRLLLTALSTVGAAGVCAYLFKNFWPFPDSSKEQSAFSSHAAHMAAVRPSRTDEDVPVTLETSPPNAHLVLHPIDEMTGRPRPQDRIVVDPSAGGEVSLKSGYYLVVAHLDDGRFQEVYRYVPEPGRGGIGPYNHTFSKIQNNRVVLPRISLPEQTTQSVQGMSLIPASSKLLYPPYYATEQFRRFTVPSFYVDQYEYTQGERRESSPTEQDRDRYVVEGRRYPLREGHNYDDFVSRAEFEGKRLLTAIEFYAIATNGGTTTYPWGDEIPPQASAVDADLSPVGEPEWDRTAHAPPVFGLCSGVAEWTTSRPLPVRNGVEMPIPLQYRDHFVIKGGNKQVLLGDLAVTPELRNPRQVHVENRTVKLPGLGCRFARSVKPRLQPEDFITEITLPDVDESSIPNR